MNADQWKRTEEVLGAVLDAPANQREAVLAALCAADAPLLAEVQGLLAALEAADHWQPNTEPDPREAGPDRHVGAYRLERLLGRGGMGAVYLGHRAEGDFDQKVAVKVIGLPFEIAAFRERFRQERQILASLNHPNITHLTDGGVTADGELYLVMELIDGESLDEYCRRGTLDLAARLRRLFLPICDAVAYAHQRLVVHRDLKPSNIMVTKDGVPKLLDFGTAKVLSVESDMVDRTHTGLGLVTAGYASPEQLRGEPVSTLTDVYSLGVIFYEIVSGVRLFGPDILSRLDAARSLTFPAPIPADLDRIARKSLAMEGADRYASVEQLAADVSRYLDGRPVLAHPPSVWYQARKFARRHAWTVSGSALALVLITGALLFSMRQARAARQERDRAEHINAFLIDMLGSPNPSWYNTLKTKGKNVTVLDVLDELGGRIGPELANQPDVEIELRRTVGRMYSAIGQHAQARQHLGRALTLQKARPRDDLAMTKLQVALAVEAIYTQDMTEGVMQAQAAVDALVARNRDDGRRILMEAYNALAVGLAGAGELPRKVEDPVRKSIELSRAEYGTGAPTAIALGTLASLKAAQGQFEECLAVAREAVALFRALPRGLMPEAGNPLRDMGVAEFEAGNIAQAEEHLTQAIDLFDRGFGPSNTFSPGARAARALAIAASGRHLEGGREASAALEASLKVNGTDSLATLQVRATLGRVQLLTGDFQAAEISFRQALDAARRRMDPKDARLGALEVRLAKALLGQRRTGDAIPMLQHAVDTLTAEAGTTHGWTAEAVEALRSIQGQRAVSPR